MQRVSVKEARQHFAGLIEQTRRGKSVFITRRGRKVAKLTPVTGRDSKPLPDMSAFRASLKVLSKRRTATVADLRKQERY